MANILAEKEEFGFSNKSHIFFLRATQQVTPRNSSPSRSANAASSRRFSSLRELSDQITDKPVWVTCEPKSW